MTSIIADDMSHEKKNTKEREKIPLPVKQSCRYNLFDGVSSYFVC
jgi:hypothetical protein